MARRLVLAVVAVLFGCAACSGGTGSGPPRSRGWQSGAWTGGAPAGTVRIQAFGEWRGAPADVVTTYPAYKTWDELRGSDYDVHIFDGFQGRLAYGLPLLPHGETASLAGVALGLHDDVWLTVADTLLRHSRGDSYVRVGLEANGTWFPWGATVTTAADFRAAYRHVVTVMRTRAPNLIFDFDLTCGRGLEGSSDRMASLTDLYPGDDVVDVVGCDHYDNYSTKARAPQEWARASAPADGPGLVDVAKFARDHRKGFSVPEWGLASKSNAGLGDNPYFIKAICNFFKANADVLLFENYFSEPEASLGSSLWDPDQNPRSATQYLQLWRHTTA